MARGTCLCAPRRLLVYDRIEHRYNRQRESKETKDQNETVHVFEYDALAHKIHDRVVALGSGVDGAVRRISTTYEVRGMVEKLTSYDDPATASGNVVNEVLFQYNDFSQLTHDFQSHDGPVNTSTTPHVGYSFTDGLANHVRPTGMTYPNGRIITYDYGAAGDIDDAASRVHAIVDDDAASTHLAEYTYLGHDTFVEVNYTEPQIKYTLVGTAGGDDPDTGDIYHGLDRFGRIKDCLWHNYGTSTDVDRIKYGYDRAGNRTYRENVVATANGANFDELYAYDLIHRLKQMDRGELDSQHSTLNTQLFRQAWSLDSTGNWNEFKEDSDGDGTWDLDQQRAANAVNEITDIIDTTGPVWVTPAYDRAGNMTTIPKPADPSIAFSATYDAWNRFVKALEGANAIAEHGYDGANRRMIQRSYDAGQLDQTRHLFYTDPRRWQVIEERADSSSDAERQFIWGLRYIDELIVRDRDTMGTGILDETVYGLQDANWNLTAIADGAGTISERFAYHAYGASVVMTPSFGVRPISMLDWDARFAGYHTETTGLYDVSHRLYLPNLTWLQRDPYGVWSGINLYEYVASHPLARQDPDGLGIGDWICEQLGDECKSAWISCGCFIISTFDTVISPRLQRIHNPILKAALVLISGLDCVCDLLTLAHRNCHGGPPCFPLEPLFSTIASCLVDIVQIILGIRDLFDSDAPPIYGSEDQELMNFLETMSWGSGEAFSGLAGPKACISIFSAFRRGRVCP